MEDQSGCLKAEKNVAAKATLLARGSDGAEREITICVCLPETDPCADNGDMRCRVEIDGLVEPFYAYGVDSLQALGLAFATLRREIDLLCEKGWEFYHPEDISEPVIFSFLYCGDESACPWLNTNPETV